MLPRSSEATLSIRGCLGGLAQFASPFQYPAKSEEEWRALYLQAEGRDDDVLGSLALLNLLNLHGDELKLSGDVRRAIRRMVRYRENPRTVRALSSSVRAVGSPGFFTSLLLLDYLKQSTDASGAPLTSRQRLGVVARALGYDLAWTQGPFFFRAPAARWAEDVSALIDKFGHDTKASLASVSATLAVPNGPFLEKLFLTLPSLQPTRLGTTRGRRHGIAQALRPTLLAWAMVSQGVHPGMAVVDSFVAPDQAQKNEWLAEHTLPVSYVLNEARAREGFTLRDKRAVFLVYAPLWEEIWGSSEAFFLSQPDYRRMAQEATEFKIEVFRTKEELIAKLNSDREEDVLILAIHGAGGKPGTFEVDGHNLTTFLDQIKTKPLKPGANLLYFICDFGEFESVPKVAGDEPWTVLAKKKLNPDGGKALAATATIVPQGRPPRYFQTVADGLQTSLYGMTGPLGPVLDVNLGNENRRHVMEARYRSPEYAHPMGFRVYDAVTGKITFYELVNFRGTVEFRKSEAR